FTAIVVTRLIFEWLLKTGLLKSLPMLQFIGETRIDFIGKRYFFYAISLIVIGAGMFSLFSKGNKAYGIDFSGGQLQEYSFANPVHADQIRQALKDVNVTDATIQEFKDNPKLVLIKTTQDKSNVITDELKKAFPKENVQVMRIERVGPVAGSHLKSKAFWALIWSLIGILVYVAFRFKHFNFAAAGVIALFHDVAVAAGFLALTNRQIDLLSVTAFLTIAGYSINDTIVIYDRVRENARIARNKMKLADLINLSVNQTLARTLLTSGITLLTVIALFVWGGEVLSNFAFTLLVGFISGVYSTVFIASPLVLAWAKKSER
ncbi:MAG: protein translocase subunit SecF, partial [Deltaproteobacteria bacterium]